MKAGETVADLIARIEGEMMHRAKISAAMAGALSDHGVKGVKIDWTRVLGAFAYEPN